MGEDLRRSRVFQVLEELMESEPRTLQQVLAASRPLSGEEFEQVAEERALAGICGSPMCEAGLSRADGGRLRRKLYQSTYCSTACGALVAEVVRGLGSAEAARRRFASDQRASGLRGGFFGAPQQPQTPPRGEEPTAAKGRPGAQQAGRKRRQQEAAGARGVGGVTVMSATVQERQPAPSHVQAPAQTATIEEVTSPTVAQPMAAEPSPAQSAAKGPSAGQSDMPVQQRSGRPRVTFADDVQGGEEQELPTGRQPGFPAAAGWPSGAGPTPQQPVLVLDMDPAALEAEPGTLGFGRLQVKEASEVPGAVPMAQDSHEFSGSAGKPMTWRDPVLGDVMERASPSKPESQPSAQPIIGEVVDRPVGDVAERPVQSANGAAAAAAATRKSTATGPAPSSGRRPSRFAAQRGDGDGASAAGGVAGQPSGSASGDANVSAAGKDACTAAATSAATRAERLQAEMAEVNARLEAEIAELSASEDEEKEDGSDAESEDSKQSTFDSLNMASTLDMEASEDEEDAPGGMPQPFARLSRFGQLFTALDGWVTRASLNFIQGEALERQPMDMEATQRCALFTQHVAGALPTLGRAVPALGQIPRAALETPLRDLATTLDFTEPLASLQAAVWDVAALACLKALSLQQAPALRPALESRDGVTALSVALAARGLSEEHFASLLDVLVPEDI